MIKFYKTKVIAKRGFITKSNLIFANSRSRLASLRNLRKGLFTFLYQAHREGIYLPTYPGAQT